MKMKGILSMSSSVLCVVVMVGTALGFTGCKKEPDRIKIGLVEYGPGTPENDAFVSYIKSIAGHYNADIVQVATPMGGDGKPTFEGLVQQGVKGVIGFDETFDNIKVLDDAGIYYIRAAGMAYSGNHSQLKTLGKYLGSMGPDIESDERAAGRQMATYFLTQTTDSKFLCYSALLAIMSYMHQQRYLGMLDAFVEYTSATEAAFSALAAPGGRPGEVGTMPAALTVNDIPGAPAGVSGRTVTIKAVDGLPGLTPNFDTSVNNIYTSFQGGKPDCILAAASGVMGFASKLVTDKAVVHLAEIESFVQDEKNFFADGTTDYIVGKNISSIGVAFAVLVNAVRGNVLKDGGEAFRVHQGMWTAASKEVFDEYYDFDNAATGYCYDTALLDTVVGGNVTFAQIKAFADENSKAEIAAKRAALK